ncbi:long-chain fatty acid--CoA ligase [Roseateles sp. So40a]|uniref:long-chain fatty acid--CoA ligase n=1 Tax=Roseateles sp. So40a TaxID=3400226 RepID=UPI003A8829A1
MPRVVTPRPENADVQYRHWPARLPRHLAIPRTSLWFNLEVAATRYPDKAATQFLGATLSFGEMRRQAEALAGWLHAQGVRKGDRVALFLQNCPQYLIAFYAINRADAVVVPVNPMNREDEFGHYLTDPETKVVICSGELSGIVAKAAAKLPEAQRPPAILVTQYWQMLPADGPDPACDAPEPMRAWLTARHELPPGATDWRDAIAADLVPAAHTAGPDDLAMLPYTSGTTGLPKGCMHTNATLMSNSCGGCQWGYASAESVGLAVVPMFHITGTLYGVLGPVFIGMTLVIMPRWDRELCGRLISKYQVTHWTCIPTMIIDLFASPNYKSFDLRSLRYLSGGGAAMPKAVAERLQQEFGLTFAEGYGLTETAAPSHGNPPERAKLQCLGIPIFGVDARIVDPTTLEELPVGEVGEIITHGPMVFQGYWRQAEATDAAFVELDGKRFFRTGDLGRMDDEGYFFITDRLKRMINASGYKVWPSEVEMLLYRHPAVQEACIIAAKDAYRGETVKAVVVLRADAKGKTTDKDIIDWSHEHMAAYKAPRIVEFVDALPKSGSGKVMWRLLQEQEAK